MKIAGEEHHIQGISTRISSKEEEEKKEEEGEGRREEIAAPLNIYGHQSSRVVLSALHVLAYYRNSSERYCFYSHNTRGHLSMPKLSEQKSHGQ